MSRLHEASVTDDEAFKLAEIIVDAIANASSNTPFIQRRRDNRYEINGVFAMVAAAEAVLAKLSEEAPAPTVTDDDTPTLIERLDDLCLTVDRLVECVDLGWHDVAEKTIDDRVRALEKIIIARDPASTSRPLTYRDITRIEGRLNNLEGLIKKLTARINKLEARDGDEA